MKRLGDEFLACTTFALNEYGGTTRSHLCNQVENAQHPFTLADYIREAVALL